MSSTDKSKQRDKQIVLSLFLWISIGTSESTTSTTSSSTTTVHLTLSDLTNAFTAETVSSISAGQSTSYQVPNTTTTPEQTEIVTEILVVTTEGTSTSSAQSSLTSNVAVTNEIAEGSTMSVSNPTILLESTPAESCKYL